MSAATDRGSRLSVIVPTLDEVRTLPALLDSLGGEHAPDEVLVVDGGSTDDTPGLARSMGVRVLSAERGRGPQLGTGAEAAEGELLLFLHADTRLFPGALAELRHAFEDPDLIATGMRQVVAHSARFYRFVEAAANARARRGWIYGDSGLCVRRSAYRAIGGFRRLDLFEDLDISKRLRRLGCAGRIRLLERAVLEVSPRRWEEEGRMRRTFLNWALTTAYFAGVSPERLVRYYPQQRPNQRSAADGLEAVASPRQAPRSRIPAGEFGRRQDSPRERP